jgi:hypothetical protein
MSYDLAVWFPEHRLTDEQAGRQYALLCKDISHDLMAHPSIEAFYNELCSIHPEIDAIPEEKAEDFDDSPWSIAHSRSDRHVLMSCVWSKAGDVHALVLELAAKHALAVYDSQAEHIHYPVGDKAGA